MMTGWKRLAGVAIAGMTLVQFAPTAQADNWADCVSADADISIKGCSAIIDAGTETTVNVATAFSTRRLRCGAGAFEQQSIHKQQSIHTGKSWPGRYQAGAF
jgi:hypothetical protein